MSEDKSTERIKVLAGIIIAVIGCIGSITAAILPSVLPHMLPAPVKAGSSLTVSDVPGPSTTPSSITTSPTAAVSTLVSGTPTPLVSPVPTDTPPPMLYIFGFRPNDKPVKAAVDACHSCQVVYLNNLTSLPEDWRNLTFNAKTSKGVPNACRTKQDLIEMGYTAFMANNQKPCP